MRAELTQQCAEVELVKSEGEREQRQLQHMTTQLEQVSFTYHWWSYIVCTIVGNQVDACLLLHA